MGLAKDRLNLQFVWFWESEVWNSLAVFSCFIFRIAFRKKLLSARFEHTCSWHRRENVTPWLPKLLRFATKSDDYLAWGRKSYLKIRMTEARRSRKIVTIVKWDCFWLRIRTSRTSCTQICCHGTIGSVLRKHAKANEKLTSARILTWHPTLRLSIKIVSSSSRIFCKNPSHS